MRRRLTDPVWWTPSADEARSHYRTVGGFANSFGFAFFFTCGVGAVLTSDWVPALAAAGAFAIWWAAPFDLLIGFRVAKTEVLVRSWVARRLFGRIDNGPEAFETAFRIVQKAALDPVESGKHLDAIASRTPKEEAK